MKKIITWIGDLFRLLTQRIYTIMEVIAVNFYSIVLLIVLYAFYWQFDQAQDLLLTLNQEKHWQVMLFFFTLCNLAAICWYMPKYLSGGPSKEVVNYQLNAPIVAFTKLSSGYVEYDEWNYGETGDAFYELDLTQGIIFDGRDTIKPIIPLARYLSPLAIEAMDAFLEAQAADANSDLNKIVREMK